MPALPVLVLFFGSGACGLIYQVVWMRALTLTLSVSVYAVTTVLVAFMAGLALGAVLAGRLADRLERPLLCFGLAELGVGLAGFSSLGVLFALGPAYAWLHAQLGGAGPLFILSRFLLACAVLIVPTALMGTTLPLLSRAAIASEDAVGRGAGGLYAINTLGAVVGCLVAGFVLIPALGLKATTAVAACANLAVGASAVALGRRAGHLHAAAAVSAPAEAMPTQVLLAAAAFGVSGFTALGYEVLWTRALEQFTHNSTYAYTAMLAVFLLGIGAGSALAAPLADRVRRPLAALGQVELGIGASVVAALLVYPHLLYWVPAASEAMGGIHSWPRAVALMFGVAGVTLLATTLLFGASFPFVARSVVESLARVGGRIATAYSFNTVGSILGAIATGFLILPALGMRGAFLVLVVLNLGVGATLAWLAAPRAVAAAGSGLALAVAATAFGWIPRELFQDVYLERYGRLLLYREEVTDIVMVTEDERGERFIRYGDGRGTAGTVTVLEDRSYAHVAMLPHPDPKRVLNLCFGVGNSLSSVAQYPVERIDQVELSPGVAYAAPFFESTNRGVLRDPRVHLTIQDGRNFLLVSREHYDVIRLDPPELHTAGIVNLYTKEFFELARDHLAPGGIFSIWVNIAYTPEPELKMILQTARTVFPYVSIWHGPWLYSWTINGSVEPRPPDMQLLLRHFAQPRVRADLRSIGIRDPFDFLNYFVMEGDEVADYVGDAPIITDDHTRIDFSVPRSAQSFFGITNSISDYYLLEPAEARSSVLEHATEMCRHKRAVFPHLLHPEASGLPPQAVAERLAALAASHPSGCIARMAGAGGPRGPG